ncbi:hypothetical protein NC653_038458 [Populus alba x Populus x berolinensis]|uniref:Uncharacterized protein n=1 Tax=Populus alba x Populus x berolinensis TaxID=444605 RepID=A0AAD6PU81_9ROSI|nr:hypothetical protein NC653_038458 [Populus alba x Populus x berolinensis]
MVSLSHIQWIPSSCYVLNQEDDDESDELESAQADVATNSNVDRHNYIAAAHMENFEILWTLTTNQRAVMQTTRWADSFLIPISLKEVDIVSKDSSPTTEEVEDSSMDSATRIGNSRCQHEQPVTIVGAPTTYAEVCNTIAAGSILDIKNQMAREASDWHAIQ